jgi:hypothetical protein
VILKNLRTGNSSNPQQDKIYLRDNFCELDIGKNGYLQWYVVRLEK